MHIVRIGGGSTEQHSADDDRRQGRESGADGGARTAGAAGLRAAGQAVRRHHRRAMPHAERHLRDGLKEGIEFLESATGKRFGDRRQPLLVSVRSGAARSMPGMLDTVLDVGCTSAAVQGLIRMTGRPRLAWDCRRRFLESYAETVLGLDPAPFAARLAELIASEGVASDRELDSEALERLAADEQALIEDRDDGWLEDAAAQLESAARAVYRSWMSERAQTYRRLQKLDDLQGTAVTVQAMVFGNGGLSSGAGVAFSRDPSTGAAAADDRPRARRPGRRRRLRPPHARHRRDASPARCRRSRPNSATFSSGSNGNSATCRMSSSPSKTANCGSCRRASAKRTPRAALRIAIDLVHEGLITPQRGAAADRRHRSRRAGRRFRWLSAGDPVVAGIGASGGIAVGRAAF